MPRSAGSLAPICLLLLDSLTTRLGPSTITSMQQTPQPDASIRARGAARLRSMRSHAKNRLRHKEPPTAVNPHIFVGRANIRRSASDMSGMSSDCSRDVKDIVDVDVASTDDSERDDDEVPGLRDRFHKKFGRTDSVRIAQGRAPRKPVVHKLSSCH